MNKKIQVKTNDPDNKAFFLVVRGPVKEIVTISPRTVSLSGAPGDTLKDVVTITPGDGFEFNIVGLKQKFNKEIKAELVRPEKGKSDWQVKVTCFSDKADDLYDYITLKTDSPHKPILKIRVYAIYFDPEPKKSQEKG